VTIPLILLALVLLWLPRVVHPLGRRISPEDWAFSSRRSVHAGVLALGLSVAGLAIPTVSRAMGRPLLAQWCDELLSHLPHGGSLTRWVATLLVGFSLLLGLMSYVRARRALERLYVDDHVGSHIAWRGLDIALLPSSDVIAYSRLRPLRQVVLSEGLLQSLKDDQLELLLIHEMAHLHNRDERKLVALTVIEEALRWLPGVKESVNVARVAIERLADELAAGSTQAARNSLSSALLKTEFHAPPACVAAFSPASGLAERVEAMDRALRPLPHRQRLWFLRLSSALRFLGTAGATAGFLLILGMCSP
jgi:hypothetical protein